MKEFVKSNLKVIVILLIVIILGVVGLTFAYQMNDIGITLTSGEYSVIYNGTSSLPSSNLTPILDTELTSNSNTSKVLKIEFTVKGAQTNPSDRDIIYDVSLTDLDLPSELQSEYLKWRLYKNGTQISEGNFSKFFDGQKDNRMVLTEIQQDLPSYSSIPDSYIFYIWISEACAGDITTCTEEDDTSKLMNKTFSGNIRIELSTGSKKEVERLSPALTTMVNLGLKDSIKTDTPDFSKTSCSSECGENTVGIYEAKDNLGTSYYFRGDVENNYVYFAGYYWRIVRINGDGTVRMIYDGTSAHKNGESSSDRQIIEIGYNSENLDNAFVGYMNGTIDGINFPNGTTNSISYTEAHTNTTDSTIKNYLENTWYANNIKNTEYEQYISDAIYCNDRSLYSGTGVGYDFGYYGAYGRLDLNTNNPSPTLTCSQPNDRFTLESTNFNIGTNGMLEAPVGLITIDEAAMAGGVLGGFQFPNYDYYLYTGYYTWSMSPAFRGGVFYINGLGDFTEDSTYAVYTPRGVRPVISLKADALKYDSVTSNGTMEHPFVVSQ